MSGLWLAMGILHLPLWVKHEVNFMRRTVEQLAAWLTSGGFSTGSDPMGIWCHSLWWFWKNHQKENPEMGRGFHRLIGMSLMMLLSQLVTLGHTPFYKPIGPYKQRSTYTHAYLQRHMYAHVCTHYIRTNVCKIFWNILLNTARCMYIPVCMCFYLYIYINTYVLYI